MCCYFFFFFFLNRHLVAFQRDRKGLLVVCSHQPCFTKLWFVCSESPFYLGGVKVQAISDIQDDRVQFALWQVTWHHWQTQAQLDCCIISRLHPVKQEGAKNEGMKVESTFFSGLKEPTFCWKYNESGLFRKCHFKSAHCFPSTTSAPKFDNLQAKISTVEVNISCVCNCCQSKVVENGTSSPLILESVRPLGLLKHSLQTGY